jgi:ribosomal protein L23
MQSRALINSKTSTQIDSAVESLHYPKSRDIQRHTFLNTMVRAPTAHGLDRKFKPWRKGKSENAKSKRGTFKKQLRGQQRLLLKTTDEAHKQMIKAKIKELEAYIVQNERVSTERENAKKSHGVRFLERQRLTRLEKSIRKNPNISSETRQQELFKIALDMVYVAHHPHDVKYMPLFRQKKRMVDARRPLYKRCRTRERVLKTLQDGRQSRISWVANELYDMLPSGWSLTQEEQIFGVEEKKYKTAKSENEDKRFTAASEQTAMMKAAEKVDAIIEKEIPFGDTRAMESEGDNDSSSEEATSSDENAGNDPTSEKTFSNVSEGHTLGAVQSQDCSDEDSDDSSLSKRHHSKISERYGERSSSDSSSESSSESDDDKEPIPDIKPSRMQKTESSDESSDDFLVAVDLDSSISFASAKKDRSADEAKGDKSKGWATQRQRPGQYKKPRIRR